MNSSIDAEREHEEMAELLPLAVGGALSDEDRAALDAHLASCASCREDLALLRSAVERMAAQDTARPPQAARASMDRVLARVEAERARGRAPRGPPAWLQALVSAWQSWPGGARWAVAGQAVALAAAMALVLPGWVGRPQVPAAPFETAGGPATPPSAGLRVRIAWRDDAPAGAVRELLSGLGAQVVSGPSAAGFYIVELPGGASADALAHLRGRSDVVKWADMP